MSAIRVSAIVTPAPGKEAQVKELLIGLTKKVEAHEKGVSQYQAFEQYNGQDGNVFVVEETYQDQATFDAHMKTDYFVALGKKIGEEGLLAKPLDIKTIRPIGGFASR